METVLSYFVELCPFFFYMREDSACVYHTRIDDSFLRVISLSTLNSSVTFQTHVKRMVLYKKEFTVKYTNVEGGG